MILDQKSLPYIPQAIKKVEGKFETSVQMSKERLQKSERYIVQNCRYMYLSFISVRM